METSQKSESETYRVIVAGENLAEVLLDASDGHFVLPSFEVPRWERIAQCLTTAMKVKGYGEFTCLFTPEISILQDHSNPVHYQVMECCHRTREAGAMTRWVPVSALSADRFADAADYEAVRQSLAQCETYRGGQAPGPFAKPGWFCELRRWVDEVIAPTGLCLDGRFCQFNAAPSFSLIRFETNGPAVWFKAVGSPNLREFPITVALARLFPSYVSPVLATRPEWSGWLALEIDGPNLGQSQNVEDWRCAAAALASLEIDSIGKAAQLLDAGVRDLRLRAISSALEPFLDVVAQLMQEQTKIAPAVLSRQELQLLGEHVQQTLSSVEQLGVPDTLGHLDLNPNNIIVSPQGCRFLDWAEACVGHPFLSFGYLLEHFRRSVGGDAGLEEQLAAAYAGPWRTVLSSDQVEKSLALAPMLGVVAYAVGNDVWSDQKKVQQPASGGYLRSLTRRLKRESDRLIAGRSQCIA